MVNSAFAEQLFLAARPLVAEVTLLAQELGGGDMTAAFCCQGLVMDMGHGMALEGRRCFLWEVRGFVSVRAMSSFCKSHQLRGCWCWA